jgi:putative NADH-flavin reductase
MKLVIFGATGRTGQHLLRQALNEDHQVTVLVRDPAKLIEVSDHLTVVQGSLNDEVCLNQVIHGADAVLSMLGPANNQPTFDISSGTQAIINAMKKNGVRRLVISAGAGVGDPDDQPELFNKIVNMLLKVIARNVYEDMLKTVTLVRESGLDWTVVRVPMLTDNPATGQVKIGMVGKGMRPRINRSDMADFMLKQASSRDYVGKSPVISCEPSEHRRKD